MHSHMELSYHLSGKRILLDIHDMIYKTNQANTIHIYTHTLTYRNASKYMILRSQVNI